MSNTATLSANAMASKRRQVLQQIAAACEQARRSAQDVTLLAVSKTQPAAALQALYDAGQRHFGENYLQEALDKMPQLPADVVWHFIGPIQSNKTRAIAMHFDWVHSVASRKVLQRLAAQRPADRPPLNICIQVNLENEDSKSGVDAATALALAAEAEDLSGLRLRGLMSIPPPTDDPAMQRAQAERVAALLAGFPPTAQTLSLGMSADLEAAIAAGSTMVRIGTALFGPRPSPVSDKIPASFPTSLS